MLSILPFILLAIATVFLLIRIARGNRHATALGADLLDGLHDGRLKIEPGSVTTAHVADGTIRMMTQDEIAAMGIALANAVGWHSEMPPIRKN